MRDRLKTTGDDSRGDFMSNASDRRVGIGILGAGNILGRYVTGMSRFPELAVVGCAARSPERARQAAADAGIGHFDSVAELLASPDVQVVLNITTPLVHAETTAAALAAGKHVYVEKPITTTLAEADNVVAQADSAGLLLGSAPDTFLGSAAQTARAALDDSAIGEPIGVAAFITSNRVETWHPDPTFLFQPGGGPVADLGPYYLTAMVNLFGPLASVMARSRIGTPKLSVTSPDRRVDSITVTVPTHVSAALQFSSGVVGTLLASFDVWDHHLPRIEVYGTEGTLGLPDPNGYDGDVLLKRRTDDGWQVLPPVIPPFAEPGTKDQFLRGPGVADLVAALGGAPQRAGAPLACHVLEAIEAIETSGRIGESVRLSTHATRPEPVPVAAGHER
jgi:predicted dehydrogenase